MKVEWVQGAPPHSHTQTLYAGTRDITRRRAYMPTKIVVAHGLLSPMPVYGWHFSAVGERVYIKLKNIGGGEKNFEKVELEEVVSVKI